MRWISMDGILPLAASGGHTMALAVPFW